MSIGNGGDGVGFRICYVASGEDFGGCGLTVGAGDDFAFFEFYPGFEFFGQE